MNGSGTGSTWPAGVTLANSARISRSSAAHSFGERRQSSPSQGHSTLRFFASMSIQCVLLTNTRCMPGYAGPASLWILADSFRPAKRRGGKLADAIDQKVGQAG